LQTVAYASSSNERVNFATREHEVAYHPKGKHITLGVINALLAVDT
jgi:hypothetical protein